MIHCFRRSCKSDLDGNLRTFAEEVLRLEGPASGVFRVALRDITLHGVTIPKGQSSRFALRRPIVMGGNSNVRPEVDINRDNAATHLSFGSGAHSRVGAPLARRELYWGFRALLERVTNLSLAKNERPEYVPNLIFRGLPSLNVTFTARQSA